MKILLKCDETKHMRNRNLETLEFGCFSKVTTKFLIRKWWSLSLTLILTLLLSPRDWGYNLHKFLEKYNMLFFSGNETYILILNRDGIFLSKTSEHTSWWKNNNRTNYRENYSLTVY